MALTREFKKSVMERATKDRKFRLAMFQEALNELLNGDFETAKILLRNYVNAAISFEKLADEIDVNDKSLQRMLGPSGNPTSVNLLSMLQAIQKIEGITIHTKIQ